MARLPKYTDTQMIEATRRLIGAHGPQGATIAAIANAIGAPSGSIYHRFRSRDLLLGRVWLDAVASFQSTYLAVAADPDTSAGDLAAHVIDWVRHNPETARLLTMYRREEFLAAGVPPELRERADGLRREIGDGVEALSRRWFGDATKRHKELVRAVAMELPYGLVRARIARGDAIPAHLSRWASAAADAMLEEGA